MATDETNYNNPYIRSPGLGDVGSYLVSGKPYYTGSSLAAGAEIRFAFPSITKEIMVQGANVIMMPLATTSPGYDVAHGHYVTINAGTLYKFDMKCKEIFFKNATSDPGSVELYASLTGINQDYMFALTGSGIATD